MWTRLIQGCLLLGALQLTTAKRGYFWHITDHHYDTSYWTYQRSCNDAVPDPGMYGDYWCDSPWRLVNDSINAMAALKRDVDFILWTGDSVAHIADEYLTLSETLAITARITSAIKTAFPGVRVFATMGNHDWFPADQFPVHDDVIYNETAEIWRDWIKDEAEIDNFRKGGYYTVELSPGLRVVSVNTILYYVADKQTDGLTDPAGQFAWLETVLKKARHDGEKVLLLGHVPPGLKIPGKVLWFYEPFNTRFLDIMGDFSDIIPAMYFGHDHADEFKLLTRGHNNKAPGIPMFMAPSVTPWRYKTPTEEADPHNPAIRLFKYDTISGLAQDYIQYYMDLEASNRVNQSTWRKAYSATEAYDVTDLSASSVKTIVKEMKRDGKYLDKYIRFNTVLANGDKTVAACDGKCRAEYICAFIYHQRSEFKACLDLASKGHNLIG